jgi:hypothetical protein
LQRLVCLQIWKAENCCCCPKKDAIDKRVCFLVGFLRQRLARHSKGFGDQNEEVRSIYARWQTHLSCSPRTWLGLVINTQKSRHKRIVTDLLLDDRILKIPKRFQGRASQTPSEHERRAQYKSSAELSGEFA